MALMVGRRSWVSPYKAHQSLRCLDQYETDGVTFRFSEWRVEMQVPHPQESPRLYLVVTIDATIDATGKALPGLSNPYLYDGVITSGDGDHLDELSRFLVDVPLSRAREAGWRPSS